MPLRYLRPLTLILILLIGFSCQSEQAEPEPPEPPAPIPRIIGPVTHYPADIACQIQEVSASPRSLTTGQAPRSKEFSTEMQLQPNDKITLSPLLSDQERTADLQSIVILYNQTTGDGFVSEATWQWQDHNWEGGYGAHYYLKELNLPERMRPESEEDRWYILSLAGGGYYSELAHRLTLGGLDSDSPLVLPALQAGDKVRVQTPFATSWRRIKWDNTKKRFTLPREDRKPLLFRPQGVLLVLDLSNWMTLGVDLQPLLTLESDGYASRGYYDLNFMGKRWQKLRTEIRNGADLLSSLWQTENKPAAHSAAYASRLGLQHPLYSLPLQLGTELGKAIHLDKCTISRRLGRQPTRLGSYYLLWLQKLDPYQGKPTDQDEMNVLYASAEVNEAGRTQYVPNGLDHSYLYKDYFDVSTWKPRLGSRYIIGSIPGGLAAGHSYLMPLRLVRPMLPIEYVGRHSYPAARKALDIDLKLWTEVPFIEELANLLHIPAFYLDPVTDPEDERALSYTARGIGYVKPKVPFDYHTHVGPHLQNDQGTTITGLENAFAQSPDDPHVVYGIMYKGGPNADPAGTEWTGETNNYMVAVRITFDVPGEYDQYGWPYNKTGNHNVRIEHYYLGPNLYLGRDLRTMIAYVMNPTFWDHCIDPEAIQKRILPFVNTPEGLDFWIQPTKLGSRAARANVNNQGRVRVEDYGTLADRFIDTWHLPWVANQAW